MYHLYSTYIAYYNTTRYCNTRIANGIDDLNAKLTMSIHEITIKELELCTSPHTIPL